VASDSFVINYAAHTSSCTFLLDREGICRRVVLGSTRKRSDASRTAARCVGAQYVASLDAGAPGGLVEMPTVGASMLFARVDGNGRVSLVRTGIVTDFEIMREEDPFADTTGVETSAPSLAPPRSPEIEQDLADPDCYDANDRTQRFQSLHMGQMARAAAGPDDLARTAEYESEPAFVEPPPARSTVPSRSQRSTLPSNIIEPHPTLRQPHRDSAAADEDNPYARPRGMLPRQPEQGAATRAPETVRIPRAAAWPTSPPDAVAARRRR
jgi:hypothetical protein